MRQTNPFGIAGRTRGILYERQLIRVRRIHFPVCCRLSITNERGPRRKNPFDGRKLLLLRKFFEARQKIPLGEQGSSLELTENPKKLEAVLVTDSDGNRHRHDAT